MENWLIRATHSLTNNIKSQPTKSFLQNILCLIVIYFKTDMLSSFCRKADNATVIGVLLQNFVVNASSVLETEVKNFNINFGQLFLKSLLNFINFVIDSHSSLTEWIFAVPMIHVLMGQHNTLINVEWNEDPSKFT